MNTNRDFYGHSGYKTPHANRKLLILDSRSLVDDTGTQTHLSDNDTYENVKFKLLEPMHIDEPTDVYLEYLQFINLDDNGNAGHLEASTYFCLDIPELKIKTYSNNAYLSNKFVIPNEIFGKTDDNLGDNDTDVNTYNVKLKSNYITTIQPTVLKSLTVSLTANRIQSSSDKDTHHFLANAADGGGIKIALLFKKK